MNEDVRRDDRAVIERDERMIARVCAAQMARTIVRALHVAPVEQPLNVAVEKVAKKKSTKGRKKKKAA